MNDSRLEDSKRAHFEYVIETAVLLLPFSMLWRLDPLKQPKHGTQFREIALLPPGYPLTKRNRNV